LAGFDFAAFDEVLVEQSGVDHDAQGHPGVNRALEFEQQIDVEPFALMADAPDEVIFPLAQVVGDVAAADFFQGGVVEPFHPFFANKAAQQIFHHARVGEQELVAGVVAGLRWHEWFIRVRRVGPVRRAWCRFRLSWRRTPAPCGPGNRG